MPKFIDKKQVKCLDYEGFIFSVMLFISEYSKFLIHFKKGILSLNTEFNINSGDTEQAIRSLLTKDWFNREIFPLGLYIEDTDPLYIVFGSKNPKKSIGSSFNLEITLEKNIDENGRKYIFINYLS